MALLHVPVYLTLILNSSSCPTPSWLQPQAQPLFTTWQRVSGSQGLQNPPPFHSLSLASLHHCIILTAYTINSLFLCIPRLAQ